MIQRTIKAAILLGCVSLGSTSIAADDSQPVPKSELVQKLEGIFHDASFANIPDRVFPAAEYGVKAGSKTVNTKGIQAAIDAAHAAGGGVVTFQPGNYPTGALFVKSNVELRLDEGVVLQAIQDDSLYPRMPTRIAGIEMVWPAALINVYEQENVRITGKGIIDGNGEYWWNKFHGMHDDYKKRGLRWALDYDCERVRAVMVWKSKDVLLKNFTIQRSGFWTVTMTYSDRVHVDGVIVRNNIGGYGPSSDGINTDSSSHVLVENCDIDCHDDNFCIKSGKDADGLRVNRPAENVVYRNSITRAGFGLFVMGSETSGGIRNVEVYGLKGLGTRTGIRIKSAKVRGGVMENIHFHDLEMIGVETPIRVQLDWFRSYSYPTIPSAIPEAEITDRWRLLTQRVEPPERGIPEVRNIRISNIKATGAKTAFFINAYSEKPIRNVHLNNVSIEARSGGQISNAKDWTMENVTLTAKSQVKLKNCQNVQLPGRAQRPRVSEPPIFEPIDGTIRIESEQMAGPWRIGTKKYTGFEGTGYASSPYSLGVDKPLPMEARVKVKEAGAYTVSMRALKGGAHQDRALAVEVAGKRLKTTHAGEGPKAGAYSWEEAGVVELPTGITDIKLIPVGKAHPTADVILLTPVAE